jgi:hypothetical protein
MIPKGLTGKKHRSLPSEESARHSPFDHDAADEELEELLKLIRNRAPLGEDPDRDAKIKAIWRSSANY